MEYNILSDLHTHTNYSHGKGTPEENVRAAIDRGLKRIAISEHGGGHVFYGVRGEKLKKLRRETDRLNSVYGNKIQVLLGYECNLTGFGMCDAPKDRSMFDILLLGYHKGIIPKDGLAARATMEAFGLGRAGAEKLALGLLAAADKYRIDIISHPGEYAAVDMKTLAAGAAEMGLMLELNGAHVSVSVEDARLAHGLGAKFCVNSDAHTPERVGDFEKAIGLAKAAEVPVFEWKMNK